MYLYYTTTPIICQLSRGICSLVPRVCGSASGDSLSLLYLVLRTDGKYLFIAIFNIIGQRRALLSRYLEGALYKCSIITIITVFGNLRLINTIFHKTASITEIPVGRRVHPRSTILSIYKRFDCNAIMLNTESVFSSSPYQSISVHVHGSVRPAKCLSIYLCVCFYLCLSVSVSLSLPLCLCSVCLSVCVSLSVHLPIHFGGRLLQVFL